MVTMSEVKNFVAGAMSTVMNNSFEHATLMAANHYQISHAQAKQWARGNDGGEFSQEVREAMRYPQSF